MTVSWSSPTYHEKKCVVCGVVKHHRHFHRATKARPTADGRRDWCKQCRAPKVPRVVPRRPSKSPDTVPPADWVHLSEWRYQHRHPSGTTSSPSKSFQSVRIVPSVTTKRYCSMMYNPDDPVHGTWTGYSHYRCRCPDCVLASREYWKSPRGRLVTYNGNKARRARKLSLPSERYTRSDVIAQQGGEFCWKCRVSLIGKTNRQAPVDHLIPLAARVPENFPIEHPGDVLANVALACQSCNNMRSSRLEIAAYCLVCSRLVRMGELASESLELAA